MWCTTMSSCSVQPCHHTTMSSYSVQPCHHIVYNHVIIYPCSILANPARFSRRLQNLLCNSCPPGREENLPDCSNTKNLDRRSLVKPNYLELMLLYPGYSNNTTQSLTITQLSVYDSIFVLKALLVVASFSF